MRAGLDEEVMRSLEEQLMFSLSPVEPPRPFVDHLRRRLTQAPEVVLERRTGEGSGLFLWVLMGLGLGILMVWMWRRSRR